MANRGYSCSTDIISILYNARGQYVSGEYLSQCLKISRTAVWKRIGALKKEGYKIEASTKKGYRLSDLNLPFSQLAIKKGLSTQVFGHNMEFYHEVDSTNSILKKLALEGAQEGMVVVADSQTKGRGRLGRIWQSQPDKGIWMSALFRPQLHPSQVQILTLAASVAVCKAMEPFGIQGLGIKWPNDILIDKKKVCGILTELSAEVERTVWVIAGIGINVNHLMEDFPEEIRDIATSLRINSNTDKLIDRNELTSNIINQLENVYDEYLKYGAKPILQGWKKYNLTLGKKVYLSSNNGVNITGTAYDILHDGRLIIKKDNGEVIQVLSGEISLREI